MVGDLIVVVMVTGDLHNILLNKLAAQLQPVEKFRLRAVFHRWSAEIAAGVAFLHSKKVPCPIMPSHFLPTLVPCI